MERQTARATQPAPQPKRPVAPRQAHPLIRMQQALGNQAVGRMVQAKLNINQPGDEYEQEADRVADTVMRMPAPQSDGHRLAVTPLTSRQAQRKCAECDEEDEGALQRKESGSAATAPATAPPIVDQALSSPGQPLDAATRAFFEPRFGSDFSRVRVHDNARAAESAQSIKARAYTHGHDIVFSTGQYVPGTTAGQWLLAHELTHVVQQINSNGARSIQRSEGMQEDRTAPPFPSDQVGDYEFVSFIGKDLWLRIQYVWKWIGTDPGIASAALKEILELLRAPSVRVGIAETKLDWLIGEIEYVLDAQLLLKGYEDPSLISSLAAIAGVFRELDGAFAAEDPASTHAARRWEALNRSIQYMPGGAGEEVLRLITDRIFLASLIVPIGAYLALWLAPEPIFTKVLAVATTLAILSAILSTGAFSISTILNLAQAWTALEADADAAQSDEEIEQAAKRFGNRIGELEADVLVFLASLLVGAMIPGPKRLPPVGKALADAERSLAAAEPGGVLIEGPWARARMAPTSGEPGLASAGGGDLSLKVEFVFTDEGGPARIPMPLEEPLPLPDNVRTLPNRAKPAELPSPQPLKETLSMPGESKQMEMPFPPLATAPVAAQERAPAAGCAVNGASPEKTGEMIHMLIQNDLLRSGIKSEAWVPRGDKGINGTLAGTTNCPPADRDQGMIDLWRFDPPVFYLAEIKPETDRDRGMREYRHYADRVRELYERRYRTGNCKFDDKYVPEYPQSFWPWRMEDMNFDIFRLNNYLYRSGSISEMSSRKVYVEDEDLMDYLGVDSATMLEPKPFETQPIEAIPETTLELNVSGTNLLLMYWSDGDGTVLYRCIEID